MTDRPTHPPSVNLPPDDDRRRYDSFTVRIWHCPGLKEFDRAEVIHLQTGHVTASTHVTSDWIQAAIDRGTEGSAAGSREPE